MCIIIFNFISGNNMEVFHLANFIYAEVIIIYFKIYNKNNVYFKQDSSFDI